MTKKEKQKNMGETPVPRKNHSRGRLCHMLRWNVAALGGKLFC